MPSTATVLGNISTAIASLTSGTRQWSDLSLLVERIPAGTLRFQVKSIVSSVNRNSNDERPALGLAVTIHRRLGAAEEERAYTENARLVHQQSLVDPQWWRAISGVHDVALAPDTAISDLARVEDIISYTVTVGVVCVTP